MNVIKFKVIKDFTIFDKLFLKDDVIYMYTENIDVHEKLKKAYRLFDYNRNYLGLIWSDKYKSEVYHNIEKIS